MQVKAANITLSRSGGIRAKGGLSVSALWYIFEMSPFQNEKMYAENGSSIEMREKSCQ